MSRHCRWGWRGDRRGFALLAALWLLVALSVIGLEFGLRARARRLAVANATEATVVRAAAEGGLEAVYARLEARMREARTFAATEPDLAQDPWGALVRASRPRQARPLDTLRLGTVLLATDLRDVGQYLNLNLATVDELRRFFVALRADAGMADRLAQRVADWRDADQLHRPRGAEREDYLRDGAVVLPDDAPFTAVTDLRYVLGMPPELSQKAVPYLTVPGTGRININIAPAPVLLALPGMTEEAVTVVGRRRDAGRPVRSLGELALELSPGPRAELTAAMPALQSRLLFETQEVLATVAGRLDGSPVAVYAEGLFVRGGDAVFLTWRRTD